ncbi:uncharacterized protein [Physcomitrium patens]|uniref:Uncharacterized protein n=2 Tax=Physcomitrium patens TaxID=3218 RepID=A0A2K1KJU8_PHYPA|nr:uncharacterized protein LOC112282315 isoform X1 [Physcomitrium patens]XP_024375536.1 uncharacterized protein LOC112282315 isoform X1 [Physcomitrium patens]PNR54033.1 hypothetical protein PHYPA_007709 [Physcomitrium patens]|eukprot:XP_024375535.1 uncharacterized protein LOC112282315 isoform X1 [Physcomitrella patens]
MQEFEVCGYAAVPFKWESAPGKPIEEAVVILPATSDPWMSPLRPPPGFRKAVKSTKSTVEVSGPEPPVLAEMKLVQKIFKMFHGLRRKYGASTASSVSEASRDIADRGEFGKEDLDRCYDSSASTSNFSVSTFGHQETSSSFTSIESSSSDPCRTHFNKDPATYSFRYKTRAQPSSFRFDDVGGLFGNDLNGSDDNHSLPGPRESVWHDFSGPLERTCVPPDMQIRRSHSILVPTLLCHSLRNFKQLSFGRTLRRSKATKQLVLEKT